MKHLILPALLSITCSLQAAPNVLLIIPDDQTFSDFGFMGNAAVHTPNLDRLAANSAVYSRGYVPVSVCSPSLATILTGKYPHQHGIHYNHPAPGNSAFNRMTSRGEYEQTRRRAFHLIEETATIPRWLRTEGNYLSLQTGKYWEGHYRRAGFTHGMTVFEPAPAQTFGGNRKLASGELAAHGNGDFGLRIGRETMQPIEDFLKEADSTPWLIWYAPYLPHEPHDSPQEYWELADKPGVEPHVLPYYASIAQFDDTVGQLLDLVKIHSSLEDTLVLLVTDNGWTPAAKPIQKGGETIYRHDKRSKRSPFEDGLRTPILLSWPGQIQPALHEELVSSIDLFPTILEATGMEAPPEAFPGISLLQHARGEDELDADRPVFGEIYPGDASGESNPSSDIAYRWVRQRDLKLIVTHSQDGAPPWGGYLKEDALFNLKTDPGETTNLIRDPSQAENVAHLRSLLDGWWTP